MRSPGISILYPDPEDFQNFNEDFPVSGNKIFHEDPNHPITSF